QRDLSLHVRAQQQPPREAGGQRRQGTEDRRDRQHRLDPGEADLRDKEARKAGRSPAAPARETLVNPHGPEQEPQTWDDSDLAEANRSEEGAAPATPAGESLSDATQLYLHQIGLKRLLTPEEELRFARGAAAGDFAARQKMIEHNLRLVVNVAKAYLNRGLPLLDLVEEGNLGLIHALGNGDPERGFRFSTYAIWWIRQNIERAIMNQSRTIRLPVHVIKDLSTVLRAKRHLEALGERRADAEDIAQLLGRDPGEVRDLLVRSEHTASLDAPLDA